MDDATIRFLIQKRIHVGEKKMPLDPLYKEKILELTKQMLEEPFTGSIQMAFDTYISECMSHLKRIEEPEREEPPQNVHDALLYPAKKVTTMVKKKSIFSRGDPLQPEASSFTG
jgi:hypothetical protein